MPDRRDRRCHGGLHLRGQQRAHAYDRWCHGALHLHGWQHVDDFN